MFWQGFSRSHGFEDILQFRPIVLFEQGGTTNDADGVVEIIVEDDEVDVVVDDDDDVVVVDDDDDDVEVVDVEVDVVVVVDDDVEVDVVVVVDVVGGDDDVGPK